MPLDTQIPLQVQQLKVPTVGELLSLKDLATRSQINETALQEKQRDLGIKNALTQIMQQPDAVDPSSGMLTPNAITRITQVDPKTGLALGAQQQQLRLQNMALGEKRDAVKRDILSSYVTLADHYRQTMGDPVQAEARAKAETQTMIEEGKKTGRYAEHGFSPDELSHDLPPVELARRAITIMGGGKPPEVAPQTPLAHLNVDYSMGRISKQDYENQKAKLLAPTFQQLVQSAKPSDQQVDYWAEVVRLGGTIPQGLARSAIGSNLVTEVIKRVPEAANTVSGKENTPQTLLANQAELGGYKQSQKTLGARQAQIEMAANVTKQFMPQAITASENYDRMPYKSYNDLQQAVQSRTASPELRKFNMANFSLINAYARAINPTGVAHQSDKEHAFEVLSTAFSKGDYRAGVEQLGLEIDAELKAPGAVKKGMRGFFTGKQEEQAPAVEKGTSKSGKPMHKENGKWVYD